MINRIDPATVAAWFKAHPDIEPIQGVFAQYEDDGDGGTLVGCCGLSSQSVDLGPKQPDLASLSSAMVWRGVYVLAPALGLDASYALGFACGWDDGEWGRDPLPTDRESFAAGRSDGGAAYAATMEALHP